MYRVNSNLRFLLGLVFKSGMVLILLSSLMGCSSEDKRSVDDNANATSYESSGGEDAAAFPDTQADDNMLEEGQSPYLPGIDLPTVVSH